MADIFFKKKQQQPPVGHTARPTPPLRQLSRPQGKRHAEEHAARQTRVSDQRSRGQLGKKQQCVLRRGPASLSVMTVRHESRSPLSCAEAATADGLR
eukprot:SAG31_NODE_25583_length_458_cov_1.654596_1_plen_96_part_01